MGVPSIAWAEPDCGAEFYIPLDPVKRARALEILREIEEGGPDGDADPRGR